MKTFPCSLLYKLGKTVNPWAVLLLLCGFWSTPTLAAVCPGGVSEQTTISSHTILCSAADFSISSSVTVTKNVGLYQLTDLLNATAADAMGTPVNLNDVLTEGTCYTFTSTDPGSIGAEYQGTIINAVGFTSVGSGACSGGGGGPVAPVEPLVTSPTSTVISDYVVSGTHPVDGSIISVIIDANLNNLIDIDEPPATGPVVVSGGSWTTAAISISGNTRFLVVANDAISGLPSPVVIHNVSYNPTPTNTAPIITGTPATSVNEDSLYSFTPTASDVDAETTLSFSITNKPTWASFNTATGALTGTPTNADVGSTSGIVISVSDGTDGASLAAFNLTVINVNDAPVITGSPATSVNEDSDYSFTPTASDVDAGATLTFSITNKPVWASFNTATGALTGTPANADVGNTTGIVISVSDGTASAALSAFSLTVVNVNDTPVITGTPATSVNEDSLYSFTPTASDPDAGTTLTFSIANKPNWASFNTATGAFTGTPGNEHVGTTQGIVISVSDGTASAALSVFSLTVVNVNDTPVITGTPATSVNVGSPYSFAPTASDADTGTTLTFSITNKPAWASFDSSSGVLSGTPGNEQLGTTQGIVISVSDGTATAALSAFDLTVVNANVAPSFTAIPDVTLNENEDLTYTLDLSPYVTDADGDELVLTVSNSINQLATDYSVDGTALQMTFDGVKSGSVTVNLSATDNNGGSATASFVLTVVAENDEPIATTEPGVLTLDSMKSASLRLADYISDEESSFARGSFKVTFSSSAIESGALKVAGPVGDAGTITVTSLKNAALEDNVQITVSDNSGKDPFNQLSLRLPVQVEFVNRPPVLTENCPSEQTAFVLTEYNMDLTTCFNDPDGDTLSFAITPEFNWLSIGDAKLVGTASFLEELTDFSITATDPGGASVSLELNFQILNKPVPDMNAPSDVRINATSSPHVVHVWQLLPGLTKDSTVAEIESKKRELVTSGSGIPVITQINGSAELDGKAVSTLSAFSLPSGVHLLFWQLIGTEGEASQEKWQFVYVVPQMTVSLATDTVKYKADVTAQFELLGTYPLGAFTNPSTTDWYRLLGGLGSAVKKVTGQDCDANLYSASSFSGTPVSLTLFNMPIGYDLFAQAAEPDPAGFTCTVSIPQDYENQTHATVTAKATILPSGESRTTASSSTLSPLSNTVAGSSSLNVVGYFIYSMKAAKAAKAAQAAEESEGLSDFSAVNATGLFKGSASYAEQDTLSPAEQAQSDPTESYPLTFIQTEQGYEIQLPEGISPGIYQLSLTLEDEDGLELQSNLLINVVDSLPELDPNTDSDGDGLSDSVEGLVDSNGNGIADYLDSGLVRSHLVLNVGQSAVIQCPAGTLCALGPDAMAAGADGAALTLTSPELGNNYQAVGTVVDFVVRQLPAVGSSAAVVVPSAQPIPAGAAYLKYNNSQWSPFVEDEFNQLHSAPSDAAGACPSPGSAVYRAGLNAGDYCIQLILQDGGPNDADGMANGEIFDPGVVALQGNQLPQPQADQLALQLNSSGEINLLANDTDPDGDALTLVDVQGSAAEVEFSADGAVQLTAPENFVGAFGFTYRVQDSKGAFAESRLEVTVSPNTLPVGVADSASTTNKVAITIDVLGNDTDADGDNLFLLSSTAQQGQVLVVDNKLRYVPKAGFVGQDSISYILADQWQAEAQGSVQVAVSAHPEVQPETKSGGAGVGGLMFGLLAAAAWRRRAYQRCITLR